MSLVVDLSLARRFVARVAPERDVVLVGVTGAHAYGFPSPDSDYDLKGIELLPLASLLGLSEPTDTFDRMEIFEGVEQDLTLHDARKAIGLLLRGNGNVLEHVLSPLQLYESERATALRALARGAISKRFVHHYRGFFHRMREEHARERRAKTLLYAYRVALTGAHLLASGELETDARVNAQRFSVPEVQALVELKRTRHEKAPLADDEDRSLSASLDRVGALLEEAHARSTLPDDVPNRDALERWLIEARLASAGRASR
ncbi:MAG: nucleotidyltransferase domain-containing protein [Sandaracinaceae bacterium]|jgi:predicted nucleotidyltransferase|nr:nucleotidyltransferase domain-containing protein [Sandaracinaceae bacterium]